MVLKYRKSFTSTHKGVIKCLSFNSSGRLLASASMDGRVVVWDSATGVALHFCQGNAPCHALSWTVEDDALHCGFEDGFLISVMANDDLQQLEGEGVLAHKSSAILVEAHKHDMHLATCSKTEVRTWIRGKPGDRWELEIAGVSQMGGNMGDEFSWFNVRTLIKLDYALLSRNERLIAISSSEYGYNVYHIGSNAPIPRAISGSPGEKSYPILFVHGGMALLGRNHKGKWALWDVESGRTIQTLISEDAIGFPNSDVSDVTVWCTEDTGQLRHEDQGPCKNDFKLIPLLSFTGTLEARPLRRQPLDSTCPNGNIVTGPHKGTLLSNNPASTSTTKPLKQSRHPMEKCGERRKRLISRADKLTGYHHPSTKLEEAHHLQIGSLLSPMSVPWSSSMGFMFYYSSALSAPPRVNSSPPWPTHAKKPSLELRNSVLDWQDAELLGPDSVHIAELELEWEKGTREDRRMNNPEPLPERKDQVVVVHTTTQVEGINGVSGILETKHEFCKPYAVTFRFSFFTTAVVIAHVHQPRTSLACVESHELWILHEDAEPEAEVKAEPDQVLVLEVAVLVSADRIVLALEVLTEIVEEKPKGLKDDGFVEAVETGSCSHACFNYRQRFVCCLGTIFPSTTDFSVLIEENKIPEFEPFIIQGAFYVISYGIMLFIPS
ncbi:hypothetical protein C8R48DRAFT_673977 [Suillus tomentosus]|nr:hypothetical protein C8R48DRAFT_673977 [Suillus tomentosus]